jgi:OOP family OmpA-OmpF porin
MKLTHLAPLSLLLLASAGHAEGFYALGQVTHSRATFDSNAFAAALSSAGANGISSHNDGNGNQWRLQAGYRFNDYVAVEAGYIDFGKAKYHATYAGGTASGDLKAGGIDLAALISAPIGDGFSIFGKIGVVDAKVKANLSSTLAGADGSSSTTVVRPLVGIGGSYQLTPQVSLRADLDHVSGLGKSTTTGKLSSNMVSLGVAYSF